VCSLTLALATVRNFLEVRLARAVKGNEISMNRKPGRPIGGSSEARERILTEARIRFHALGYAKTTMRGIANASDVDPALVRYHFGTKKQLFALVLGLAVAPADVLERALDSGSPERMPERLVALVIRSWENRTAIEPLMNLAGAALRDAETMTLFRGYIDEEIVATLESRLTGPGRADRAAAAIEVVVGLVFSRYILQIPSIAQVTAQDAYRRTLPPMRAALLHRLPRS